VFFFINCFQTVKSEYVITDTEYGKLAGLSKTLPDGRPYDVYLGVPYARPPVGNLRWEKPQSPEKEPLRIVDKYGPYCTQIITPIYRLVPGIGKNESEDCLYLNVYVPKTVSNISLPVMFFVYGGSFVYGNSDIYGGEQLAVNGEVIVVTYNYRVATMGFLSSASDLLPGNYGLWDGKAALKWVKENIANFGGDPKKVTIFGQSAGGASVSHMSLSDSFDGLFQRVIEISGSAASFFGTTYSANIAFKYTAKAALCISYSDSSRKSCLEKISAPTLDKLSLAGIKFFGHRLPNLLPVVDGELIKLPPLTSLQSGASAKYDLITGNCEMDAAFEVYNNPLGFDLHGLFAKTKTKRSTMSALKSQLLGPYENVDQLYNMILNVYPDIHSINYRIRTNALITLLTDFLFGSLANLEASQHSRLSSKNTYLYEYAYRNSFMKYVPDVTASHIDDLNSIFGEPFLKPLNDYLGRKFSHEDKRISLNVQKYYSNFAYTGNPNEGPHKVEVNWPQFNESDRKFLKINSNSTVNMDTEDKLKRYQFWNEDFTNAKIIRDQDHTNSE